ncbi:G-protein coupled receptor 55-like isoform X2 [Hyperolius riggenbachi]
MTISNSSCSEVNVTYVMSIVQYVTLIPIFILGFILNAFALWFFCCSMKRYTETSIYLINLAVLDFFLVLSLPIKLHFSQEGVNVSSSVCVFLQSLYFTNMYGSIYTLMFISVDRYVAIIHPFWARVLRSRKKTLVICIIIWLFVWCVALYTFRFEDQANVTCFHNMSSHTWSTGIIVSVELFGFLIPMTVIMYCSTQIVRTLLVPVPSSTKQASKATIIRIIISNLVVFLLSFSFSHMGIFLQFLVRREFITNCSAKRHISLFVQVALCIANFNCCLDGLSYYFAWKGFLNRLIKNSTNVTLVDNTNTCVYQPKSTNAQF